MIVIGAKGFAKEVLEVLYQKKYSNKIVFYDDSKSNTDELLFNKFEVLKNEKEAQLFFEQNGNEFTLGVGNPKSRYILYERLKNVGGELTSTISPLANIGHFGNSLGKGLNIMTGTIITNNIKIGDATLINLSCTIGHDTVIGEFVEICPNVNISGECHIGDFSFIGTNAIVLPNITIGKNVTIGAGTVVNKNIPDNSVVVGSPARVIKTNPPLEH